MKVRIDDWNSDGRGRGQLAGRVALVSQAIPGETVELHEDRRTRGTLQGRVGALVEADARRIEHACQHEFLCTGCPFLALDRDRELSFKSAALRRVIPESLHPEDLVVDVVGPHFGYRTYAKRVFHRQAGRVVLGSFIAGTHEVADNAACPILDPELTALLDRIADWASADRIPVGDQQRQLQGLHHLLARYARSEGRAHVVLVADASSLEAAEHLAQRILGDPVVAGLRILAPGLGNALLGGEELASFGAPSVVETLLGQRHAVDAQGFFQVNPVAAAHLFELALGWCGEGGRAVEAFAGGGAMTQGLLERFQRVTAIERSPASLVPLRALAERDPRLTVIGGAVEEELDAALRGNPVDALLMDPPRAGLREGAVAAIAAAPPARIVLLACAPESLARTLPALCGLGYVVAEARGVDQFPRTAHVEAIVRLDRVDSPGG